MRAHYLLLLLIVLAGCQVTGNAVSEQAPSITIGDVRALGDAASVTWRTSELTQSTFQLGSNVQTFNRGIVFTANVDELETGQTYYYQIKACDDEGNCATQGGQFITSSERQAPAITAAAVTDVRGAKVLGSIAGYAFFLLLGAVVIAAVAANVTSSPERTFRKRVRSATAHAQCNEHEKAIALYNAARALYAKMERPAQVKHYDSLTNLHSTLLEHTQAKEAQRLTEKFSAGTISREELSRLQDLMSR